VSQPSRLAAVLQRVQAEPTLDLTPEQRAAREEAARRWADEDARMEAQTRQFWKDEVGIPKRYRGAKFDGAMPTPAILAVRAYLAGEDYTAGRCLILGGNTGCGKTHAICAGFDELAAARPSAAFFYFPSLVAALLDSRRRADSLWAAKSNRVLALDDFGAAYLAAGGLAEALVEEILVERESQMLSTIVTTNLTTDELRQKLSDRLVDRIGGDWGRVVSVTGPSLRRRDGGR
jgi:DNA replication protein DnaC